jgi:chromosome partitioning protein
MQVVAVINQKGGVGKTTTAVNLGAALARLGKQVLLLDMDPQANLSLHLDKRPELEAKTVTHLLVDGTPLKELVQPTSVAGLWVVPADTSLNGVEQVLANRIGRETILREALEAWPEVRAYDWILIDCPPALGVLAANALVAADQVLIPVQPEYFALQGMAKLMEVIALVQKRLNRSLRTRAILPCLVDSRTRLTQEVLAEIRSHFPGLLSKTTIRTNVKLAEAPSFGKTIFEHAPESNGATDYLAFAAEFLDTGEAASQPGTAAAAEDLAAGA